MSQRYDIVFDSLAPPALAKFWADALVGYAVRGYDDEEIKRLAARGLTPDTDTSVAIDGPGPTIWFQSSHEPTTHRNRIHLDFCGSPRALEVNRLLALGATVRDVHDGYTVMLDPEGNQFCVAD